MGAWVLINGIWYYYVSGNSNSKDREVFYYNVNDLNSSIEIGSTGTAVAGSFTIDAGATLNWYNNGFNQDYAPYFINNGSFNLINQSSGKSTSGGFNIVQRGTVGGFANTGIVSIDAKETLSVSYNVIKNDGSIAVAGGALALTGQLTGSGNITISSGGNLSINGPSSTVSANTNNNVGIIFSGTGNVLSLAANSLDSNKVLANTLYGFNAVDAILYSGTITNANVVESADKTLATLTLLNGTSTVATIKLDGDYTGANFLLSMVTGGYTQITTTSTNPHSDNAPTIISNGFASANENVSISTGVYTISAIDADAGNTLSYSILGGIDAALFNVDSSTGVVTFKNSPDFEAPKDFGGDNIFNILVQASDGKLTSVRNVDIGVMNVNEAPSITSAGTASTQEILPDATVIYQAAASDPDAVATLSYSISGGADAALFNINSRTGAVTFKATPDFEAPKDSGANNFYDLIVQVSDGSLSGTKAVAITVSNENEAPSITSDAVAATFENVSTAATVYQVSASDPDSEQTLSYSISGGADAALFNITSSTGTITFKASPDFEKPKDSGTNNVYDLIVQVSDGALSATKAIAITVSNVNEAPSFTSDAGASTVENVSSAATVYQASASDPDVGATLSYSISGGSDAALFNIDSKTGAVTFKASPDFEAPKDGGTDNVYDLVVQVSDGGLSTTKCRRSHHLQCQ